MTDKITLAPAAEGIGASEYQEEAKAADASLPCLPRREQEADYPGVLCQLDDHHRLIEAWDRLQWVIQRYSGARWRGISFHRQRTSLMRVCREKKIGLPSIELPEWHP